MAAERWVVLDSEVRVGRDFAEKESEWAIKCADRRAYTYSWVEDEDDITSVVKGMTLAARILDPPDLSSLSIRLSADVLRGKRGHPLFHNLNIRDDGNKSEDGDSDEEVCLDAYVEIADGKLIVLTTSFENHSGSDYYYLIYDAPKKSLSMIPHLPGYAGHCTYSLTRRPLPLRPCDGDDYGVYSLAIIAKILGQDVLCLWPPPETNSKKPMPPSLASIDIQPWGLKKPHLPSDMPVTFVADLVFQFKGQAFWVDLGQGILYCNCQDVLSGDFDVQFQYVQLPNECQLSLPYCRRGLPVMYRTMSYVGDTIRFFSMGNRLRSDASGNMMLTTWSLHPATRKWSKLYQLSMDSLWRMEGFEEAGLPHTVPIHPILSRQQDGVIYFLLADDGAFNIRLDKCEDAEDEEQQEDKVLQEEDKEVYLFGLDMYRKSFLSSSRVRYCHYIYEPNLMGFDSVKYIEEHCLLPLQVAEGCQAK